MHLVLFFILWLYEISNASLLEDLIRGHFEFWDNLSQKKFVCKTYLENDHPS